MLNILGIGTDIVNKNRIEKLWNKYKESFAKKILSTYEQQKLNETKDKISYLAKRFAAKESVVKSFGTGFRNKIVLTEIEIYNDNFGKPEVRLLGTTKDIINELQISKIFISISDEKDTSIAFCITQCL